MATKAILKLAVRVSLLLVMLSICTICNAKIIYVDDSASEANNGSSWTDAYFYLQDALGVASEGDEIRVAQGVYTPDLGASYRSGDQNATFQLKNGVTLKGGYVGLDNPEKSDERSFNVSETILSADLNGEDNPDVPTSYVRSKNVVTGSNTDETAILDGFTILGIGQESPGVYFLNVSGNPTIKNCKFTLKNSSSFNDNGCYNNNSSPTFIKCIFELDQTFTPSEFSTFIAMKNESSNPVLTDCIFRNNQYCINNEDSDVILENCEFLNNSKTVITQNGGSLKIQECTFAENTFNYGYLPKSCITNDSGDITIKDSSFTNNSYNVSTDPDSSYGGSACVYNSRGNLSVTGCLFSSNNGRAILSSLDRFDPYSNYGTINNCIFINNSSDSNGGAIYGSNFIIQNCTFSGNSGNKGGAIFAPKTDIHNCVFEANIANSGSAASVTSNIYNCTFYGNLGTGGVITNTNNHSMSLTNCIMRSNESNFDDKNNINVTFSNIEGGWQGEGNFDIDPVFVRAGYWENTNNLNLLGDNSNQNAVWIMGDYHLKSQAGRWDSDSESWVKDDISSPCIDAGNINSPIGFEPFPNGGICNLGAYGRSAQASKRYFENNHTGVILAADINGDSIVDYDDLNIVISQWLLEGSNFINQAPIVTLIEPQEGDQITWTGILAFKAQASDVDGEIASVSFKLERRTQNSYMGFGVKGNKHGDLWEGETSNIIGLQYGDWTVSAIATDNEGAVSESKVSINIVAP